MTRLPEATVRDTESMTWKDQVCLAPIVKGSELAFRQVARRCGVKTCHSPMLRAKEVIHAFDTMYISSKNSKKNQPVVVDAPEQERLQFDSHVLHEDGKLLLYDVLHNPEPLVAQLCGNDPQVLANATSCLLELHYNPSVPCTLQGIDLNLGCPQSCALDEGHFGAFLAEKDPDLAMACIAAMRNTMDQRHQQEQQQQQQ